MVLTVPNPMKPPTDRELRKRPYYRDAMLRLAAYIEPEPNTGCWLWSGSGNAAGYGNVTLEGRWYLAHRAAWVLLRGPIPNGLTLDHLCGIRCCVNPDHLEPVTQATNTRRAGTSISQQNATKTHCKNGHPFDKANTRVSMDGAIVCRKCRTCHRLREATRRARRTKEKAQ